jgi:glycosyltransferase involved in cell wall biosynthesis
MAKAGQLGLGNLSFLGALPKAAIPGWLAQMDCLFLGFKTSPLYVFGVSPNKLFDYMMAGKPIVYAISAGNDTVAEAGCGVSVPADDPGAVAEGILALHRASPGERLAMGLRGKDHILANHTYPQLAARFLAALAKVPS